MGSVADDGALVGESVEGDRNHAAVLEQEGDLADGRAGRKALKQGAEQILGALAAEAALLVGCSLLDLGENAIVVQAAEADRVENDLAEAVAGFDRGA